MRWAFADCVLDVGSRVLQREGVPVAVEPQVLRILEHLVEHRDRVVPRDELLVAIWGGPFVSDAALTSRIRDLRAAVGDDGTTQAVIRTVRGAGYRFVAATEKIGRTTADGFLGRDEDLAAVRDLLASSAVVTLCGPGGVGKTTLARRVAELAEADGSGAVHVVELAGLAPGAAPADVAAQIAGPLGIQPAADGDLLDGLGVALAAGRPGPIVLDNAEHLLSAVRVVVRHLVDAEVSVRFLVTSRRRLDLSAELVHVVGPLSAEDSAELITARVSAAGGRPDWRSDDLDELCDALDRLPLALELAAARIARSGFAATVRAVSGGDHHRLRGPVDADPRHASLDAMVRWGIELVTDAAQDVLGRLSVFAGTFTTDDAVAVCTDEDLAATAVDRALDELAEASLVTAVPGRGPAQRYRLPYLIRQQAERLLLDERAEALLRERHARRFAAWSRRLAAGSDGEGCADWMAWLDAELDNVRAAFRHGLVLDDPSIHLAIVASVARDLVLQFRFEVVDWLDAAIAATPDTLRSGDDHVNALALASEAAGLMGRHERRDELNALLREVIADRPTVPRDAIFALNLPRFFAGDLSLADVEDELAAVDEGRDPGIVSDYLMLLALVRNHQFGDVQGARAAAERMLHIVDDVPLVRWQGWARYVLAESWLTDDPEIAIELLTDAGVRAERLGHRYLRGIVRVSLSTAHRAVGDPGVAADELEAAIADFAAQGNWQNQWVALRTAIELIGEQQPTSACLLAEALDHHPACPPAFGEQADRIAALVAGQRLDERALGGARRWSAEQIVERARAGLRELASTPA